MPLNSIRKIIKTKIVMRMSNFNAGGQTYQSPSLEVLDVLVEGLLCTSGTGDIDNATEEDWGILQ